MDKKWLTKSGKVLSFVILFFAFYLEVKLIQHIKKIIPHLNSEEINQLLSFLKFGIFSALFFVCVVSILLFYEMDLLESFPEIRENWVNAGKSFSMISSVLVITAIPLVLIFFIFSYGGLQFDRKIMIYNGLARSIGFIAIIILSILFNKEGKKNKNIEYRIFEGVDFKESVESVEDVLEKNDLEYVKKGKIKKSILTKFDEYFRVGKYIFIGIQSQYKKGSNRFLYPKKFMKSSIYIGKITSDNKNLIRSLQEDIEKIGTE